MAKIDGADRYVVMRFKRVKTWSRLHDIRRHNMREMECRHLEEGAPGPKLIFGSADVPAHVRDVLEGYGVKERPGEVLALEFIVSTSREVFDGLKGQEYRAKLKDFLTCACNAFSERFTIPSQIAAMVLHEDERTPHLHVVVIPLIHEPDNRRKDKSPIYRLSAKRVVGGRGDMSREQTRFASHFEAMGLVRGKVRSGARHVSNRDHEARLEAACLDAFAEREEWGRERDLLGEMAEELEHDRAQIERDRQTNEAEAARLAAEGVEVERMRSEAEALKDRAIKRTKKLRRLLIEGENFERRMLALPSKDRNLASAETLEALQAMRATSKQAADDDEWLASALTARGPVLAR